MPSSPHYSRISDAYKQGLGGTVSTGIGEPEDAHMPGLRVGEAAEPVFKLVFKIAV